MVLSSQGIGGGGGGGSGGGASGGAGSGNSSSGGGAAGSGGSVGSFLGVARRMLMKAATTGTRTAPQTWIIDPASDLSAVGLFPGMMFPYGGSAAPDGYLLCNGAAVSRTTYAALFGVVGTSWGVWDGSTTFNIPDLRGRVIAGLDSAQVEFDALGETGGAKTATADLAAHTHTGPSHTHALEAIDPGHSHGSGTYSLSSPGTHTHGIPGYSVSGAAGAEVNTVGGGTTTDGGGDHSHTLSGSSTNVKTGMVNTSGGGTDATGSTGAGGGHGNLQPYGTANFIIKT